MTRKHDARQVLPSLYADRKVVYAFDHIPKCAGSSLHALFSEHLERYVHLNHVHETIQYMEDISNDDNDVFFCGGHQVFGMHELLDERFVVRYFTFLRHPLHVAFSIYNFSLNDHKTNYGSFIDYLYDHPCRYITEHLGGSPERAIARLESYAFVGFVESLAESLAGLGRVMGASLGSVPYLNVSRKGRPETLESIDIEPLRDYCSDFRVYDHFLEGFVPPRAEQGGERDTPRQYTSTHENLDGWQSRRLSARDLAQALASQTDPVEIDNIAWVLAKINVPLNDGLFDKIVANLPNAGRIALSPRQVDTRQRFDAVLPELLRFYGLIRHDQSSFACKNFLRVVSFMANTAHARGQGMDIPMIEQALDVLPHQAPLRYALAQKLRLAGRHEASLKALDRIRTEDRWTLFSNEYLAGLGGMQDAPVVPSRLGEEVVFPHLAASRFLRGNMQLSSRVLLSDIPSGPVLVVQSGPVFLLHDLMEALAGAERPLALMTSHRKASGRDDGVERLHFDGWFDPSRDYGWNDRLDALAPRSVILLCSSFSALNGLHNFVERFSRLPGAGLYAYMVSNCFAGREEKSLVPLC